MAPFDVDRIELYEFGSLPGKLPIGVMSLNINKETKDNPCNFSGTGYQECHFHSSKRKGQMKKKRGHQGLKNFGSQ